VGPARPAFLDRLTRSPPKAHDRRVGPAWPAHFATSCYSCFNYFLPIIFY
ncbi:hypothetical protein PanWU01x14_122120, partial [Parasponia andersonii]